MLSIKECCLLITNIFNMFSKWYIIHEKMTLEAPNLHYSKQSTETESAIKASM